VADASVIPNIGLKKMITANIRQTLKMEDKKEPPSNTPNPIDPFFMK